MRFESYCVRERRGERLKRGREMLGEKRQKEMKKQKRGREKKAREEEREGGREVHLERER